MEYESVIKMKYIKINKDKLKSEEINKVETRIKILMIKSQILFEF